jgi:dTDP-4-amino-4,6-dideoxygalactose transaminase
MAKDTITQSWTHTDHKAKARIVSRFNPQQPQVLITLSVRSALDLFLSINKFPKNSEFVLTAINIPDMVRVIRHHGLIPVPVDIDPNTLAPNTDELKRAISEKTVCILIAHIYNRRNNIDAVIDLAAQYPRKIHVLEDCAEAFAPDFTGNPRSDLVFFSFGSIKSCTSFGGGITKVRDPTLFKKMDEAHSKYPIRGRGEIAYKMAKYLFILFFINSPTRSSAMISLLRFLGYNHRELVVSLLRGFPDQFFEKLRQQPCNALIRMLDRQFATYNTREEIAKNTRHCEYMRRLLPQGAALPGMNAEHVDYWLFPVLVKNPDALLQKLDARGMDAYRGATQLRFLEPPSESEIGRKIEPCLNAKFLIDHVIYLPVHKNVPLEGLEQISRVFRECLNEVDGGKIPSRL